MLRPPGVVQSAARLTGAPAVTCQSLTARWPPSTWTARRTGAQTRPLPKVVNTRGSNHHRRNTTASMGTQCDGRRQGWRVSWSLRRWLRLMCQRGVFRPVSPTESKAVNVKMKWQVLTPIKVVWAWVWVSSMSKIVCHENWHSGV